MNRFGLRRNRTSAIDTSGFFLLSSFNFLPTRAAQPRNAIEKYFWAESNRAFAVVFLRGIDGAERCGGRLRETLCIGRKAGGLYPMLNHGVVWPEVVRAPNDWAS